MGEAVQRRLQQELGMTSELEYLYTFQYQASYEDLGSEHEMCWVYVGLSDDEPRPNPNEIADHRWIDPARLDHELRVEPSGYTPWFQMEWPRVREGYRSALGL
jgi:isopentenyl-diphosphate delta-isomerase